MAVRPALGLDDDPEWVRGVRGALLNWADHEPRALPWRGERDPYRVLVSEMMLVQTTVAAVKAYYARFLERFPTVQALAAAEEAEVLKVWESLGYYRRARQLHEAARQVVNRHGGQFPDDAAALQALPGVGAYVAGALRSFAFGQPAPILEANSQRVLARLLAWDRPVETSESRQRFWRAADRLVQGERPGALNQAMMDLGATVCSVEAPRCLLCPVAAYCRARQDGVQDRLPLRKARAAPTPVQEVAAIVWQGDWLLLGRRGTGGLWAGMWELPTVVVGAANPAARVEAGADLADLENALTETTGLVVRLDPVRKGSLSYTVTRYRVTLDVVSGRRLRGRLRAAGGVELWTWVRPEDLSHHPMGAPQRRAASGSLTGREP